MYLLSIVVACVSKNKPQVATKKSSTPSLLQLIDSLQLIKEELHILIDKSDYKLLVMADISVLKTYPVVFGTKPIDDKLMQGDRSTPEENFKVRDFYLHKSWSKFMWIDYHNDSSWKKHNQAKNGSRNS